MTPAQATRRLGDRAHLYRRDQSRSLRTRPGEPRCPAGGRMRSAGREPGAAQIMMGYHKGDPGTHRGPIQRAIPRAGQNLNSRSIRSRRTDHPIPHRVPRPVQTQAFGGTTPKLPSTRLGSFLTTPGLRCTVLEGFDDRGTSFYEAPKISKTSFDYTQSDPRALFTHKLGFCIRWIYVHVLNVALER